MVLEAGVGAADDGGDVRAGLQHEHGVNPLLALDPPPDYAGVLHAGLGEQGALDVLGKDVEPLRRDDHLLLAALDDQPSGVVDFANVARVKPAILERSSLFTGDRLAGCAGRAVVPRGHVLAPDEDFAIGRDLHLDAADGRADRAA
jgi:hypothetical protein